MKTFFNTGQNTTYDTDIANLFVPKAPFTDGGLWVWGDNDFGQLGTNDVTLRSSPVQTVAYSNNWRAVAGGQDHAVAIKSDGTLWAWGDNTYGQIGDNTITKRSSPVQTVAFGNNWVQVAASRYATAAIKTDGTLWTWGRGNPYGETGIGVASNSSSPTVVSASGNRWKQVSGGYNHMAGIKVDGRLYTWGRNDQGQLGTSGSNRSDPGETLLTTTDWKLISCGFYHNAAIKTDGTLWMWGGNTNGALGVGDTTLRSSPIQTVAYGNNWKQVSAGQYSTFAIKTDGTLWAWGQNTWGELGTNDTTNRSSPIQTVAYGTSWKQTVCGDSLIAAIKTDGTLWTWGYNGTGALGTNNTTHLSSPVQTIAYGTNWKRVGACHMAVLAVKDNT